MFWQLGESFNKTQILIDDVNELLRSTPGLLQKFKSGLHSLSSTPFHGCL